MMKGPKQQSIEPEAEADEGRSICAPIWVLWFVINIHRLPLLSPQ